MERRLEDSQVQPVAQMMMDSLDDMLRGCMKADSAKLFGEFATKSVSEKFLQLLICEMG